MLTGTGNLSDRSFVTRFDYSATILTFLSLNLYVQGHLGRNGEFRYELEQPPLVDPAIAGQIPADVRSEIPPAVLDGFRIPRPIVRAGGGLRLAF